MQHELNLCHWHMKRPPPPQFLLKIHVMYVYTQAVAIISLETHFISEFITPTNFDLRRIFF